MKIDIDAPRRTFARQINPVFVWGHVFIRRVNSLFELRHVDDEKSADERLAVLTPVQLREWAQTQSNGKFRPLKSAPTLRSGWRLPAPDLATLELAISFVYPGSMADWHAVRTGRAAATSYRAFTSRQTGIYRCTHDLTDDDVIRVIEGCCDRAKCLKRRLWSIGHLPADAASEKSLIPCLEPCALLLDAARKMARKTLASDSVEKND